jgi:hypothetical protein
MSVEFLIRHWALVIASVLGVGILLFVLWRLYALSPRGRLQGHVRLLRTRKKEAGKALSRLEKASGKLAKLQNRAEATRPRFISEAEEALQDARMLKEIADDQVLRAQKVLRDVILEEFPPNRHDALRSQYL